MHPYHLSLTALWLAHLHHDDTRHFLMSVKQCLYTEERSEVIDSISMT